MCHKINKGSRSEELICHEGEQFRTTQKTEPYVGGSYPAVLPLWSPEQKQLSELRSKLWAGSSGGSWAAAAGIPSSPTLGEDISLCMWPQTALDNCLAGTPSSHCPHSSSILNWNSLERYCRRAPGAWRTGYRTTLSCDPPYATIMT